MKTEQKYNGSISENYKNFISYMKKYNNSISEDYNSNKVTSNK